MTTKTVRLPLRVVFYYEQDRWIAHCLEFDLMGDGESQKEAFECLSEAISLQVEATLAHDNPENLFTPADGKYFHKFAMGRNVAVGEIHIRLDGVEIDSAEIREYLEPEFAPA